MSEEFHRRGFLRSALFGAAAASLPTSVCLANAKFEFEISLNERSLARALTEKKADHLDLARIAKVDLGISAVEYSSKFFRDNARDSKYLDAMNASAAEHGVRQLLIMVDDEGRIADADATKHRQAIANHRKWVDVARSLGCHSIQLDPTSSGEADEQQQRAGAGLAELCQYAAMQKINVLLGNYGGVSASATWVVAVSKDVNSPCCGTLPQIGKLTTDQDYANLAPMIPLAKGLTARTQEFNGMGREKHTDYMRAVKVVQQAGYRGYVGIHYAGNEPDEMAGIRATKSLLETVRGSMGQDANGGQ